MPSLRLLALALATLGLLALGAPASAVARPSRELPEKFRKAPYAKMSLSVGWPNDGWQIRAKKLRSAPYLAIQKKSRKRVYGHPSLVLMLQRSAKQIARARRGSVLLVGDLSRKEGGPLSGHHSHQSGRDADVAFYARDAKGRSVKLDHFVAFAANGKAKDGSGLVFDDDRNWLLVRAWARDSRADMAHVFISNPLRARLLAHAKRVGDDEYVPLVSRLFKQPENAEPHDDHFHVRIRCPDRHEDLCHEEGRRR
jgi:penicillin-insensitive murein endopeptidase